MALLNNSYVSIGYRLELQSKNGKNEQPLIINMYMHHGIYITLPDKKVQMYERDFDVYMEYISYFKKVCGVDKECFLKKS
jgi:hypothetical protein